VPLVETCEPLSRCAPTVLSTLFAVLCLLLHRSFCCHRHCQRIRIMALPASSIHNELLIHLLAPSAQDRRPRILFSNCFASCLLGWIQESLRLHILISQPVLPVLHAYQAQMVIPVVGTAGCRTSQRLPSFKAEDRPRREACEVNIAFESRCMQSADELLRIISASRARLSSIPYSI
jgi:hypothetical protein